MIKIVIEARGEVVMDNFVKKKTTLIEVASALFRLEQIKTTLLGISFEDTILLEDTDEDD